MQLKESRESLTFFIVFKSISVKFEKLDEQFARLSVFAPDHLLLRMKLKEAELKFSSKRLLRNRAS